jgi:hypothetical protein
MLEVVIDENTVLQAREGWPDWVLPPEYMPGVYLFVLFVLLISKKSKLLKSTACLGKAIPITFHILFFFDNYNLLFVRIGMYVTSTCH